MSLEKNFKSSCAQDLTLASAIVSQRNKERRQELCMLVVNMV